MLSCWRGDGGKVGEGAGARGSPCFAPQVSCHKRIVVRRQQRFGLCLLVMLGRTWRGFAPRQPGNARPLQQRGARAGCNCAAERFVLGAGHKALMNPADVLLWSEKKPFQKLSSHLKQQQQGKKEKRKRKIKKNPRNTEGTYAQRALCSSCDAANPQDLAAPRKTTPEDAKRTDAPSRC